MTVRPGIDTLPRELLVCPVCRGRLRHEPRRIECTACRRGFAQPAEGWIDLLPPDLPLADDPAWSGRQEECDRWYADLLTDPAAAVNCYERDFTPHAPFLSTLTGTILDIGGGNGVVRQYLLRADRYVTVEPSTAWLRAEWGAIANRFTCLGRPPAFVRAIGEHIPFRDSSVDAVLSFWSLNHVTRPASVVAEIARVLRPGGGLLIVLEDMPPSWLDLATVMRPLYGWRAAARQARFRLRLIVTSREWPLQSDHIRIRQRDLERWARPAFMRVRRAWIGSYLTYEFRRRAHSNR
jgi:SAM-dependent methyltransferase